MYDLSYFVGLAMNGLSASFAWTAINGVSELAGKLSKEASWKEDITFVRK